MDNSDQSEQNWEYFYTQFKYSNGDPVICMVHRLTKKFIYVDIKSRRILSKPEALDYRVDVTGLHIIYSEPEPQDCPPPDSLVKIA